MVTTGKNRDPRSIITPDAFDVSAELVGMPLAPPSRRAAALAVDLVVIGLITLVTKSFSLIVGAVAAGALIRAGFKRTPVRGSVFGRAMRLSVGCLGVFIAGVTLVIWLAVSSDLPGRLEAEFESALEDGDVGAGALDLLDDSIADVVRAALREARDSGVAASQRDTVGLAPGNEEGDVASGDEAPAQTVLSGISAEARDTIVALEASLAELRESVEDERRAKTVAEARLAEATAPGLFGRLRDFADELGFGFSWAILYSTILLSWWNGQTVGKRLLGVRVVRLDGEPITWWVAFERAGGYAAGFATGLLGFAQVWWDANRQAIHDRIVGTVVVLERAEKVTDWESAL